MHAAYAQSGFPNAVEALLSLEDKLRLAQDAVKPVRSYLADNPLERELPAIALFERITYRCNCIIADPHCAQPWERGLQAAHRWFYASSAEDAPRGLMASKMVAHLEALVARLAQEVEEARSRVWSSPPPFCGAERDGAVPVPRGEFAHEASCVANTLAVQDAFAREMERIEGFTTEGFWRALEMSLGTPTDYGESARALAPEWAEDERRCASYVVRLLEKLLGIGYLVANDTLGRLERHHVPRDIGEYLFSRRFGDASSVGSVLADSRERVRELNAEYRFEDDAE